MSQNGQGWSTGEPYSAPADPWGDAAGTHVSDDAWGGQPVSVPPGYAQDPYTAAPLNTPPPVWQHPPEPPVRKRTNGPIVAIVVVLVLLICGGLGTTAWLVRQPDSAAGERAGVPAPSSTATQDVAAPETQPSQDARFVSKGQCVRNEGHADDSPQLTVVECTDGTYEVLKRVDGRTTGEADAEGKCSKVANYTKWYFYDSELDSLDFVLCLREYGNN
ncbi:hypothetical protein [Actinoplanes sp. NPDC051494]|uniref:LppU/SCO3897 family protein n=1 Tax=Actinoplanes sp. NPDC051494 TaxID=3363907 RepID=UPI0037ACC851